MNVEPLPQNFLVPPLDSIGVRTCARPSSGGLRLPARPRQRLPPGLLGDGSVGPGGGALPTGQGRQTRDGARLRKQLLTHEPPPGLLVDAARSWIGGLPAAVSSTTSRKGRCGGPQAAPRTGPSTGLAAASGTASGRGRIRDHVRRPARMVLAAAAGSDLP